MWTQILILLGSHVDTFLKLLFPIVNRGEWFGSSANIKGANKDAKI